MKLFIFAQLEISKIVRDMVVDQRNDPQSKDFLSIGATLLVEWGDAKCGSEDDSVL